MCHLFTARSNTFDTESYVPPGYTHPSAGEPVPYAIDVVASRFKQGDARDLDLVTTRFDGSLYVLRNNAGLLQNDASAYQQTPPKIKSPAIAAGLFRSGPLRDVVRTEWQSDRGKAWVSESSTSGVFTTLDTSPLLDPPYKLWHPYGVATGKLNDDNNLDRVYACQHGSVSGSSGDDGGVIMIAGNGHTEPRFAWDAPGQFSVRPQNDPTWIQPKPCFVQVADLDKDGWNDVAASCNVGSRLAVLLNANEGLPPG